MPRPSDLSLQSEVQQIRALLNGEQENTPSRECRIQVLCRFRDQSESERQRGGFQPWSCKGNAVTAVPHAAPGVGSGMLTFPFDRVFEPGASQGDVYKSIETVVEEVPGGVNAAVLCYGQTSAGKTFTMEGIQGDGPALHGIIQRSLGTLFNMAAVTGPQSNFHFSLSMLEIYMERLRDLLCTESAELRIVEDRLHGVSVRGLREFPVTNFSQALDVFRVGQQHRAVVATGMNERSSRSHSVFIIKVEQTINHKRTTGKLYLVDLAGSECLKKVCVKDEDFIGQNVSIVEGAKAINKSLSTLGLVVSRLASRQKGGADSHIPYRSSKLTRVLQDSLGGSSHTVLIINCSSSSLQVAETISTLRFGARAGSIVNTVTTTANIDDSVLLQTLRNARLEIENARLEIERLRSVVQSGGQHHGIAGTHVIAGSRSHVPSSAVTSLDSSPCHATTVSPIDLSPSSRRVSRGPINWRISPEHSVSPIQCSPVLKEMSLDAYFPKHNQRASFASALGSLSPLCLSPRSAAVSRRVSRVFRQVPSSSECSDKETGQPDEEPEVSNGSLPPTKHFSPYFSFTSSRNSSSSEINLSGIATPLDECPKPGPPRDLTPRQQCWDYPLIQHWEYPLTQQETLHRMRLLRDKQVLTLQEDLEHEQSKCAHHQAEIVQLTAQGSLHVQELIRSLREERKQYQEELEQAESQRVVPQAGAVAARIEASVELRLAELRRTEAQCETAQAEKLAELDEEWTAHVAELGRVKERFYIIQAASERLVAERIVQFGQDLSFLQPKLCFSGDETPSTPEIVRPEQFQAQLLRA